MCRGPSQEHKEEAGSELKVDEIRKTHVEIVKSGFLFFYVSAAKLSDKWIERFSFLQGPRG